MAANGDMSWFVSTISTETISQEEVRQLIVNNERTPGFGIIVSLEHAGTLGNTSDLLSNCLGATGVDSSGNQTTVSAYVLKELLDSKKELLDSKKDLEEAVANKNLELLFKEEECDELKQALQGKKKGKGKSSADDILNEVKKLVTKVDALTGQVAVLTSENTTLRAEVGALTGQNTTLQAEVGALAGQNTTLQAEVGALAGQVAVLASENTTLQAEVGALTGQNTTLQAEVGALAVRLVVLESLNSVLD